MSKQPIDPVWQLMGVLFRGHPWHGVHIGDQAPLKITCYIEVVPSNQIKYELDKTTGILRVDRPQKYSNICPTPYGFIPQTHCAEQVAALSSERTGKTGIMGDDDPLDVCVLTEKNIEQGDILLEAYPIGGLRMLDGDEADDKIIAVMEGDAIYGDLTDVSELQPLVLDRIKHYFLTYKEAPGSGNRKVTISDVYGRDEAHEVILRSQNDYKSRFGNLEELLTAALRG